MELNLEFEIKYLTNLTNTKNADVHNTVLNDTKSALKKLREVEIFLEDNLGSDWIYQNRDWFGGLESSLTYIQKQINNNTIFENWLVVILLDGMNITIQEINDVLKENQ